MSPEARARKIIKDWLAKPGATIECDLYVPMVEALREAAGGATNPSKCEKCGAPLAGKRLDAAYCSDACRVAAFRARVAENPQASKSRK